MPARSPLWVHPADVSSGAGSVNPNPIEKIPDNPAIAAAAASSSTSTSAAPAPSATHSDDKGNNGHGDHPNVVPAMSTSTLAPVPTAGNNATISGGAGGANGTNGTNSTGGAAPWAHTMPVAGLFAVAGAVGAAVLL